MIYSVIIDIRGPGLPLYMALADNWWIPNPDPQAIRHPVLTCSRIDATRPTHVVATMLERSARTDFASAVWIPNESILAILEGPEVPKPSFGFVPQSDPDHH